MTPDQLHFEKYLLEQSKKRLMPKPASPPNPFIIPIDISMNEKAGEYLYFFSAANKALMDELLIMKVK